MAVAFAIKCFVVVRSLLFSYADKSLLARVINITSNLTTI